MMEIPGADAPPWVTAIVIATAAPVGIALLFLR
jgi:hypothetical protein